MRLVFALWVYMMTAFSVWSQEPAAVALAKTYAPLPVPDRVVLTWMGAPATSQAVSWRTDTTVVAAQAQLALASPAPGYDGGSTRNWSGFSDSSQVYTASTSRLATDLGPAHYHTVEFSGLQPQTLYTYRVGDAKKNIWSEWFHFRTASLAAEPFSFIYLGDAQNELKEFWSRLIRGAFSNATHARFVVHAGDLVNRANADAEWGEWYYANGWITGMRPVVAAAGNHEYAKNAAGQRRLSAHWRAQFALPVNGPEGLEESVYYLDYQGVRLIVLNSNERIAEQTAWLAKVLRNNTQRWAVAVFHHPVFSSARGRDNKELRQKWMPVLDRYRVDLVLQGHDHTYGRTGNLRSGVQVQDDASGTVYVVSVSGPKMYRFNGHSFMRRGAEDTQLYQVISIDGDTLEYRAYTAIDQLYDAFDLHKKQDGTNALIELESGMPQRVRGKGKEN